MLILNADDRNALEVGARQIAEGKVIAIPTDTVYGLACDAFCEQAVGRIYQIKGRSEKKPLVLFLSEMEQAVNYAEVSELAAGLMRRLWPGPVTFVCRAADSAPAWVCSAGTVGLRMPDHPVPLALVRRTGTPLATTSANISGEPAATSAAEVCTALSGQVSLVIDGGPSADRCPSTVLDVTGSRPRVLRRGGGQEQIRRAIAELTRELRG